MRVIGVAPVCAPSWQFNDVRGLVGDTREPVRLLSFIEGCALRWMNIVRLELFNEFQYFFALGMPRQVLDSPQP